MDVEEALGRRGLPEATVLASAMARRSVSAAEHPVRDIGRQLFEALFTGSISASTGQVWEGAAAGKLMPQKTGTEDGPSSGSQ